MQVLHTHSTHYLQHPKLRIGPACNSGMPASVGSSWHVKMGTEGGFVGRKWWWMHLTTWKILKFSIWDDWQTISTRNIRYTFYNHIRSKISSLDIMDDDQHYLIAKILTLCFCCHLTKSLVQKTLLPGSPTPSPCHPLEFHHNDCRNLKGCGASLAISGKTAKNAFLTCSHFKTVLKGSNKKSETKKHYSKYSSIRLL